MPQGDLAKESELVRQTEARRRSGARVAERVGAQRDDDVLVDARQVGDDLPRVFALTAPQLDQRAQLVVGLGAEHLEASPGTPERRPTRLSHGEGIRSSFEGWYAWHPGGVVNPTERHAMPEDLPRVCVAYLCRESEGRVQVLLGRKKRGLGTGHFVGLGGKFEEGETEEQAVVREIEEEAGVVVAADALERRGDLYYLFPHRPAWSQRSTVFVVRRWSGEPSPSDELDPVWFDLLALPLSEMWDDAKHWLPAVLDGGHVSHEFTFGHDLATVDSDRTIPSGSA